MPEADDRRRFSRVAFEATVKIRNEEGEFTTELVDISLNGVLVKRPPDWTASNNGLQKITISGPGNAFEIRMNTRTGHEDDSYLGMQCIEIDIDSATSLRRLIELNLGDSALLNREFYELCHRG